MDVYGDEYPVPTPLTLSGDELLGESRITTYRFDLLGPVGTNREAHLGTLDGVQAGGYVDFAYNASIKGGGKIAVTDTGQEIDWLNVRIRPTVILSADEVNEEEFPVGVYIPSAPKESWQDGERLWDVELLDKAIILDQDVPTDVDGYPLTYALDAGTVIIDAVISLIESVGESTPAIARDENATLAGPMTWDLGTSKLVIINDLLAAANYFSLYCDGLGQFRADPYIEADSRAVTYEALAPFSFSDSSLMAPEWSSETDIYSIPNRYVAIGVGDEETPALVAVAVNLDAESPYSYPSRGRWITEVATGVEAASQVELDGIAARNLSRASSSSTRLDVKHAFLPALRVNKVIRFVNSEADIDMKATVTSTNIPFDPTTLCTTKMSAVSSVTLEEVEE